MIARHEVMVPAIFEHASRIAAGTAALAAARASADTSAAAAIERM